MTEIYARIIRNFNLQDDEKGTAQTKAEKIINKIVEGTIGIKNHYSFQTETELLWLFDGLSDPHSKGVTYWDYIEVDTLLSLQRPKTTFPDEIIFITYHQICELYFKLIILQLERIADFYRAKKKKKLGSPYIGGPYKVGAGTPFSEIETWKEAIKRSVRYFHKLISSFDVLKSGLSSVEFGVFRNSLLPASGFQTYQFRCIEIILTPGVNLTTNRSTNFKDLYWRRGAIEMDTGKEAKVLQNFNDKYDDTFRELVKHYKLHNLYTLYTKLSDESKSAICEDLIDLERSILLWKLAHLEMIKAHIPETSKGTGGTNWREYLPLFSATPPVRFNKKHQVIYFPSFWTDVIDNDEKLNNRINTWRNAIGERIKNEIDDIYASKY
jgi:tryptophan 2,3-dioxygenase